MNTTKLVCLLFVIVLFPLFFIAGPDYYSARSTIAIWNMGHILFFAAFTCIVRMHFKSFSNQSFRFQFFIILALTLFIGVFIEVAQNGTTRTPDPNDLLRNIIGSLTALFFFTRQTSILEKQNYQ